MKTLYVTDLDGTLLNSESRISEYTLETVNSLVEKGMLFTYATARSLVSASVVTKGLSAKIPVISYNGTFIFNAETGEIISSEWFSREETQHIIEALEKHNISPFVYAFIDKTEKLSWVTARENEGGKRYISLRDGDPRVRPLDSEKGLYDGDIFYFTCIGDREELQGAYDELSKDERLRCTIQQEIYRPEYWFEIMPKKASKANAIEKLKKLWGCEKIVSFGDAINDIPMFSISDECYAVENAVEELKKIATQVIDSNDNDGVAKWLSENAEI